MTMAAALTEARCLHCHSASPSGPFCCHGCEAVYGLLQESGLNRYYALRGERTLNPVGERHAHESPWREALAQQLQGEQRNFQVDIQGLQCGACVWLIEALFRRHEGGLQIQVNPALGQLACTVDSDFALEPFLEQVESFGYRLGPPNKRTSSESDGLLLRTGVAVALALNAMLLGAATYFGLEDGPLFELVENAGFVLATLSVLLCGSYFVARAYRSLRLGVLHLDLPIALGIVLAYAGSALAFFSGLTHQSYLDTLSVFVAVMLIGRFLQERLIERNRRALLEADGSSGLLARRVVAGRVELVACAELRAGDSLLVCPGEFVPVRAQVQTRAECSLDWIHGESEPRSFESGAELPAGAVNAGAQAIELVARADFARSDLETLIRGGRTVVRLAGDFWDRLARVYVLLVLAATVVGTLSWYAAGATPAKLIEIATAILIVTCPCAFGIATPLAYELAVAGLRKRGLFVREGAFFERAARIRQIVFDKTGTLTTGALELANVEVLSGLSPQQRQALYDLTARSNHPKSAAVASALRLTLSSAEVHEFAGQGLETVQGGVRYRFGSAAFACASSGARTIFAADGLPLAELLYRELARTDAEPCLRRLALAGYRLWIASGDGEERVQAMAARLGVPRERALSGLTPEGKHALLQRIDQHDTLMLGDGINDGPALTSAYCAGTPAVDRPFVPSRADFYYLSAGLAPIQLALETSRCVRGVVHHALYFAAAYNVLSVGLCIAGLMRPWLAALMMPASSLVVVAYVLASLSPRSSLWKS